MTLASAFAIMSHYSTQTRQRSEDTSNDTGSPGPENKRQKNLDTQRAFRARKAAHVKDLEVKVALQELEIARLKRENAALRSEVSNSTNGGCHVLAVGNAAGSCTGKAVDGPRSFNQQFSVPLPSVLSHPLPDTSVSGFQHHIFRGTPQLSTIFGTLNQSMNEPHPASTSIPSQASGTTFISTSYKTSELPVFSAANLPPQQISALERQARTQGSEHSLSQAPMASAQSPFPSSSTLSSASTSTSTGSFMPISPLPAAALTRITCCNGLFQCEDENEATWVKQNTGIQGIGSNTVDDFYSLFGDSTNGLPSTNHRLGEIAGITMSSTNGVG